MVSRLLRVNGVGQAPLTGKITLKFDMPPVACFACLDYPVMAIFFGTKNGRMRDFVRQMPTRIRNKP